MLIDDVTAVCRRLAPAGWADLLAAHGLDLGAGDLAAELTRPLPGVDRSVPGFEDFALEGQRAIEPGEPARSLLFHAFASAAVTSAPDGTALGAFPTAAEIDVLESYVYGVRPPSLPEVLARASAGDTAIVVFAAEYRPAVQTPHRRHADLCLSRTGVSRVGTAPARYDGRRRGYVPTVEGDPHAIRVLPSRFAAYLAVRVPGSEADSVPMRFRAATPGEPGDGTRQFWVPCTSCSTGRSACAARTFTSRSGPSTSTRSSAGSTWPSGRTPPGTRRRSTARRSGSPMGSPRSRPRRASPRAPWRPSRTHSWCRPPSSTASR